MQIRTQSFVAGAIAIISLAIPAALRAQAAAGPIHPLRTDAGPHAPAPVEKKPLPRHELWGNWTLNAERSDDPTAKLQKARGPNIGGGSPTWGGYPGGRGGYPGGSSGAGRQSNADRNHADDLIYPQDSFALAHNDAEVDLTDNEERKRAYFTDGRKLKKSKDEKYQELAARWDGARLVSEEKGPNAIKITRSFEISADGQHLNETLAVNLGYAGGFVLIRYVFDPAKPEAEPPATAAKSAPAELKP
jgi:hypothetical protein